MSLDGPDSYFEGDWGADEETNANAHVSNTDEPEQEAPPANEAKTDGNLELKISQRGWYEVHW